MGLQTLTDDPEAAYGSGIIVRMASDLWWSVEAGEGERVLGKFPDRELADSYARFVTACYQLGEHND